MSDAEFRDWRYYAFDRLKEDHTAQEKALTAQLEDHRSQVMELKNKMKDLQAKQAAQKEANNNTENLVEEQRQQLTKKDKYIKVHFSVIYLNKLVMFPLNWTYNHLQQQQQQQ